MREIPPSRDDRVTYAVVQNSPSGKGRAVGGGGGETWPHPCVSQMGRTRWAPWWQRLGRGRGCPGPGMVRAWAGASQLEVNCISFQTRGLRPGPLGPWGGGKGGQEGKGQWEWTIGKLLTTLWLPQAGYERVTPEVLDGRGIHYSDWSILGMGAGPGPRKEWNT